MTTEERAPAELHEAMRDQADAEQRPLATVWRRAAEWYLVEAGHVESKTKRERRYTFENGRFVFESERGKK